jgi:hypothetical protein
MQRSSSHSQNPAIVSSSKDIPRAVIGYLIDRGVYVYYSNLQCSSPYPQMPALDPLSCHVGHCKRCSYVLYTNIAISATDTASVGFQPT